MVVVVAEKAWENNNFLILKKGSFYCDFLMLYLFRIS